MTDDTINRQMAIDAPEKLIKDCNPEHFVGHQKFIEFMDNAEIGSFGNWQFANGFNMGLTVAEVEIKKLPSAQPEWIPISEQMPKKAGNYLVTDHKGDIARFIFLDSKSSKDYWMRCVKAWMSLPKPYKEGD